MQDNVLALYTLRKSLAKWIVCILRWGFILWEDFYGYGVKAVTKSTDSDLGDSELATWWRFFLTGTVDIEIQVSENHSRIFWKKFIRLLSNGTMSDRGWTKSYSGGRCKHILAYRCVKLHYDLEVKPYHLYHLRKYEHFRYRLLYYVFTLAIWSIEGKEAVIGIWKYLHKKYSNDNVSQLHIKRNIRQRLTCAGLFSKYAM